MKAKVRTGLVSALLGTVLAMPPLAAFAANAGAAGTVPSGAVSIADYGATPNDDTDDLAAIRRAVADAEAKKKSVFVPKGTFLQSDLIVLDGARLAGTGADSIIKSTNKDSQAIVLTGNGSELSDLKLTTVPVTRRSSSDESARVFVKTSAVNFAVRGVTIDGASSAGIINYGSRGTISGNTVANTLADGIHNTGGASDIVVENNVCTDNGDDQIAVVSYEKHGKWSKNITIRNNELSGGYARGITVSGGENVRLENNRISNTGGSGIYIASEGNYKTYAVNGITAIGNTIRSDSYNPAVGEKGGIRLQATNENPSITDGWFENNTLIGSADSGILVVGSVGVDAVFRGNTIAGPQAYGIRVTKTVTGSLVFENNKVTGAGKAAYANESTAASVRSDMSGSSAGGGGSGSGAGGFFYAVKGTPVIDGTVDALWAKASALPMDAANGTTGIARVAWDEQALYYLFVMKDATPNAKSSGENNDSVEVWVDELNAKNGTRLPSDYQLRVDLNGRATSVIEGMPLGGVKSAVVRTKDGYIAEFAVPYRALLPKTGAVIGFNASANDDADGDGRRDAYISWVDRNLPYWADTRVYNEIILADPGVGSGAAAGDGGANAPDAPSTPQPPATAPGSGGGSAIKVTVDGKAVAFQASPVIKDGSTVADPAAIAAALKATYKVDAAHKLVALSRSGKTVEVAAVAVNGKLLLPIRPAAEGFGYAVRYDAASRTVAIASRQ